MRPFDRKARFKDLKGAFTLGVKESSIRSL